MDMAAWLKGLGLGQYVAAFRDAAIDAEVLPELTDEHLKDLGLPLGHRLRLLKAIAALGAGGPAHSPRAERRHLTVMFVDLVGSTALATRLDPEDLRELIGAFHARVAGTVGRFGGYVAQYLGDGVLTYFGYPRAEEDDAERAIRAGLELTAEVRALARPPAGPMRARVGIATGLVVAGDLIGGPAHDQTVVGETPNLAARLQALAEPDSVVIDAATQRLVGNLFESVDLGAIAAKGFATPLRAYRVLRPGVAESRFEALHAAALTPLVGREEELALLVRRWAQAKAGEGRVVLLSGEPGIGKSRLLASLEERIEGEPHVRLRYFCSSHHQASALQPIRAQLERAAGFGREDPPEARLAKLEALLSPAPAEDIALVAELLSVPGGERYPPPDLAPQRKRARTFAALLQQLEALARRGPVVSIFEDAHWMDPSTRELLDLTVERVAHLPVLLVVTFRPELQPPWTGQPHVTTLALSRLGRSDGASLVRGVAGAEILPDHVLDEIVERADGVPLFAEELTKAVVETGGGEAAGRVIAAVSPAALALPATLHASLLARLDRLGPAAREVAQIGAAIGRDFAFELLSAVADSKDSELASALAQLVGAGLVFQRGALPEASFVFKHTLVQDVAYGTLLRDRRRELHARIASAIEERFPEAAEATPELIAHHFTEAGLADRAVRRWLTAGQRAAGRSADWEAVRHLRRGLEALATLPPTPERDRLELDFQLALGPPLVSISGFTDAEADAAFERAAQLCEGQGDTARLVMPLFGLFQHRLVGGRCLAARAIAERLRALADRGGDPVHRLVSHRALGTVATATGSLAEARAELEAVAALYDARRDQALVARYSTDPGASGLAFLALVLWVSGFPEQARRASRDAIRAARGLEHVNTTCHVRLFAGAHLAELLRDPTAAEAEADAVIALAAEHRLPSWQNRGRILRGWALGQTGRVKEGLALVRQGMAELDRLGTSWHRPHQVALLAELYARVGDPATGLRLVVEEAHEQVRRTGEGFWAADLYRVEGRLRRLTGAPADEVEACFEAALSLARQQGARSYELRAATSLARLRRDQGRRREALDLLAPVHAWFTEGFDTPDLKDAEALLAELR